MMPYIHSETRRRMKQTQVTVLFDARAPFLRKSKSFGSCVYLHLMSNLVLDAPGKM